MQLPGISRNTEVNLILKGLAELIAMEYRNRIQNTVSNVAATIDKYLQCLAFEVSKVV
jgi:hypothetical protein